MTILRALEAMLHEDDRITLQEAVTFLHVHARPGMSISELVSTTGLPPYQISRIITRLSEPRKGRIDGLLKKRRAPDMDGRSVQIHLTDYGYALADVMGLDKETD